MPVGPFEVRVIPSSLTVSSAPVSGYGPVSTSGQSFASDAISTFSRWPSTIDVAGRRVLLVVPKRLHPSNPEILSAASLPLNVQESPSAVSRSTSSTATGYQVPASCSANVSAVGAIVVASPLARVVETLVELAGSDTGSLESQAATASESRQTPRIDDAFILIRRCTIPNSSHTDRDLVVAWADVLPNCLRSAAVSAR